MENNETPVPAETLDINQIMALLPHRYPFLLIDRVIEIERKKRIVAIKNVTINEPFFQGHFPGYPIMPGVLVVEAMAQAGGVLMLLDLPDPGDKLMLFTGVDGAKFRRPITPGDQLVIEVKLLQARSRAVRMEGSVRINGKLACEAILTCQLVNRTATEKPAPETKSAPTHAAEDAPIPVELQAVTTE